MYCLIIDSKHGSTENIYRMGQDLIIGRSDSVDLPIDDEFASRRHLRIFSREGVVFAEDLRSKNGSRLNGRSLEKPTPIVHGDLLKLSNHSIRVVHHTSIALELKGRNLTAVDARTIVSENADLLDSNTLLKNLPAGLGKADSKYANALSLLLGISSATDRSEREEVLLSDVAKRLYDFFRPDLVSVWLMREDGALYEVQSERAPTLEHITIESNTVRRLVIQEGQAIVVKDVHEDLRFETAESVSHVTSLVAAPLLADAKAVGMITLITRSQPDHFSNQDLEIVVLSGASVAQALKRYRLQETNHKNLRDLELAREIQNAILQRSHPPVQSYEFSSMNIPSRVVSGDFLKIARLQDRAMVAIAIVDVSGKGIAAAMLTASIEALYSGMVGQVQNPAELCSQLSELIYQRTAPEKYATAFFLILNSSEHTVLYCNAGHPPGFLIRNAEDAEPLSSTGPPLGLIPGPQYAQAKVELKPGSSVFLYTDGITEAQAEDEEEYGVDRLRIQLAQLHGANADAVVSSVDSKVQTFSGLNSSHDDRTIMLLRRLPA